MTKANTQPSAISKSIAQHLQSVRKGRGLSLDKTAKLTGVSKAMLGQIERGESSPTIATLWKIATGLECSFSSFWLRQLFPRHTLGKFVSPLKTYYASFHSEGLTTNLIFRG